MESNIIEEGFTEEGLASVPVLRIHTPERRRHMRLEPPALSAILYTGDERQVVSIGDISLSGAKILNAPSGLKAGDTLQLATCLHGRDLMTVLCKVAYIKGNEAQLEAGVHFEDVDDAENHALISYLRWLLNNELEDTDQVLAR